MRGAVVVFLSLLFSHSVLSQYVFKFSDDPRSPAEDLQQGPMPKYAPDGKSYAFITNTKNKTKILVIAPDSTVVIPGAQNNFQWSHNGDAIIYTSKEMGKNLKILMYHLASGETTYISGESNWSDFYPAISPNDSMICYYQLIDKICQIRCWQDGLSARLFDDERKDYLHPKWSPSGKYLLYWTGGRLEEVGIEIMEFESRIPFAFIDGEAYDFLCWTSNDDEIIICENNRDRRLLKLNIQTGDLYPLTDKMPEHIYHAEWSTTTNKVVFATDEEIYTVNLDGTALKKIGGGIFPSWHPSGNKIIYVSTRGGYPIYEVDADGKNAKLLYNGKKRRN